METDYYKHLIFNSSSSHLDVPPMDNQPVFLIFTKAHLISKINLYFKGKLPHIVEIYNNNLCIFPALIMTIQACFPIKLMTPFECKQIVGNSTQLYIFF